ncbi:heme-binding protein [Caulobacter sp.]|jgi:glc operon protein GlcG|uniref:heme-binding protein n=1 Tax=Caulobacter sp. TaxID=78 RepID=UPI001610F2EA
MKKTLALIAASLGLAGGVAEAQTPAAKPAAAAPAPNPSYGRLITLAEAKAVAAAAEAEAAKNGWTMTIAVTEPNGATVLIHKMDGTQYASTDIARGKAETASGFRRPTGAFQDAVKGGNLNAIFAGALAIEGGELLLADGKIVGAIGVSGGTPAQDGVASRAGAAALK